MFFDDDVRIVYGIQNFLFEKFSLLDSLRYMNSECDFHLYYKTLVFNICSDEKSVNFPSKSVKFTENWEKIDNFAVD